MLWALVATLVASAVLNVYLFLKLRQSTKIISNVIHSTDVLMEMTESISSQIAELKDTGVRNGNS